MSKEKIIIVGLGNPGEKYAFTRHNTGRIILNLFLKKNNFPEWEFDKKSKSLISASKIEKKEIVLVLPETFMNNSGPAVKNFITSKTQVKNLIVIHDDLDIPLEKFKISFNKSSAGHKGVESIIKNIKTKEFIRIRAGITPTTKTGKLKKPDSKKLLNFIISDFKKPELEMLKKTAKKISEAIETIIRNGKERAMNIFN